MVSLLLWRALDMLSDQAFIPTQRRIPAYPQAQERLRRLRLGLHVDGWTSSTARASLVLLGFSVAATALVALLIVAHFHVVVSVVGLAAGVTSFRLRQKLVRLRGPWPSLASRAVSCFSLALAMQLCVPALWSVLLLVRLGIAHLR